MKFSLIELLVIIAFIAIAAAALLPRLLDLGASYRLWVTRQRMRRCARAAARALARRKAEFPGCEDAVAMAWPTTGATGNGNVAAAGSFVATGTGTTLLWGTANWSSAGGLNPGGGYLTITKITQRTLMAAYEKLLNGDGATAGTVQVIDGFVLDVEVRDDVNQVTANLTVGQKITIVDGAGMYPGGARNQTYSGLITEHDWDTSPKTPAGRKLTIEKYMLIS